MKDLYNNLESICEMLEEELEKTNKKLEKAGGQMSAGDLDYVNKLTHSIKSVKTTMAMADAEEDGFSFDNGMNNNGVMHGNSMSGSSYKRGYSGSRGRRDSIGRYSSRGYSRDNDMVMELRELMEDAPDNMRSEFQRFINKVESM